jgi:hypothetical protein
MTVELKITGGEIAERKGVGRPAFSWAVEFGAFYLIAIAMSLLYKRLDFV